MNFNSILGWLQNLTSYLLFDTSYFCRLTDALLPTSCNISYLHIFLLLHTIALCCSSSVHCLDLVSTLGFHPNPTSYLLLPACLSLLSACYPLHPQEVTSGNISTDHLNPHRWWRAASQLSIAGDQPLSKQLTKHFTNKPTTNAIPCRWIEPQESRFEADTSTDSSHTQMHFRLLETPILTIQP